MRDLTLRLPVQCALCGGGSAQGELLDASWCSPKELPEQCKDGTAPLGVRRARFPPHSALTDDDVYLSMMSMRSADRPVYVCDASYAGIPGMVTTTSTPNPDGIARHTFDPASGWERVNDTTDNYAWSNANRGVYITWDQVGPDVPETWDAGNALSWGYQADAHGRTYSRDASYCPPWGFSYVRPTCEEEAAALAAAGNAAVLYPTTGSCYINQPPYWVEECHYGNVRLRTLPRVFLRIPAAWKADGAALSADHARCVRTSEVGHAAHVHAHAPRRRVFHLCARDVHVRHRGLDHAHCARR